MFLFQDAVGYRQCGRYMCPVLPNLPTGPVPPPLTHPDMLVCSLSFLAEADVSSSLNPCHSTSWAGTDQAIPLSKSSAGLGDSLHHPDPPCQTRMGPLPETFWGCSDFFQLLSQEIFYILQIQLNIKLFQGCLQTLF